MQAQPNAALRFHSALFWVGLILIAGIPRILGAFWLPNAFGDAYAYLQLIEVMRAQIVAGTFSTNDLYGFWFPLYQLTCAAIGAIFGHSFYVAKLVSALCGTGICLFVFQITQRLTANRLFSLIAFALVALSPLHILNSVSALTDIPHAFLVIACLYFVLEKRWEVAALFAAAAGFVRIESWMLIALLPILQFIAERRVSLLACGILLISPLLWFYISWKATGNPLAYFEARNRYVVESVAADPAIAVFTVKRLLLDAQRLLVSTNVAVLAACLAVGWRIVVRAVQQGLVEIVRSLYSVLVVQIFFFANLGFLLLAYFMKTQPSIWTRYGLLFFALGIPVLAWAVQTSGENNLRQKRLLAAAVICVFFVQTYLQAIEVAGVISEEAAQHSIADYLKDVSQTNPTVRVFCEDGSVRFLSGIPWNQFLNSTNVTADSATFLNQLRQSGVAYVVCTNWEFSTLTKLYPDLRQGRGNANFQPMTHATATRSKLDLWVYRIQ